MSGAENGRSGFWQWVVGIVASASLMLAGALWNQVTEKFTFYDTLVESRNLRTSALESRVTGLESAFNAQDKRLERIERKIDALPDKIR